MAHTTCVYDSGRGSLNRVAAVEAICGDCGDGTSCLCTHIQHVYIARETKSIMSHRVHRTLVEHTY